MNRNTVGHYLIINKEDQAIHYVNPDKSSNYGGSIPKADVQDELLFSPICSTATSLSELVGIWALESNSTNLEGNALTESIDYFVVESDGTASFYWHKRGENQNICFYQSSHERWKWKLSNQGNSQYRVMVGEASPIELTASISRSQQAIMVHFLQGSPSLDLSAKKTDIPTANQIAPICSDSL